MRRFLLHFSLVAVAALLGASTLSNAQIRLSHLMGDDMILQQNSNVNLWGWASPGKTLKVTTSWDGKTYSVTPGKDGAFKIGVPTPKGSYIPYTIDFVQGKDKITLKDVLVGEVWLATGQSNMEMPVRGFGNCPVEGLQETLLEAKNYPGIHICRVQSKTSMVPLEDADCQWKKGTAENVQWSSATAYYFARVLNSVLDIPVGIVEAHKGGTRVESWLTKENLEKYTDEELTEEAINKRFPMDYHRSMVWGNATFHPTINYTVKGIIFYQGCSNVGNPGDMYSDRLAILASQWREQKGEGDIPFYIVEIAPFADYGGEMGISGALLREQQYKASKKIPNSGIITTNDCVYPFEKHQIHPRQKRKVGERLAFLALNKTYSITTFGGLCPEFKAMEKGDGFLTVTFENMNDGFARTEGLEGFEVAGEDRVFHPATAVEAPGRWQALRVSSPEVPEPVAVRYCFRNWLIGNCANALGFPLLPFRSDNWDN